MTTGYSRRHGRLQPRSSLKMDQARQFIRYKAHESLSARVTTRRTGQPYKNGSLVACSTWHSKTESASAATTPPVAEAAVPSTALSNTVNGVGGYTAGTLGDTMHDCVKWVFAGQRALKQAQEWQTVLELAQPKRQGARDAPSCPLSEFIITEASKGGVIALTSTQITRQHDIVSFP